MASSPRTCGHDGELAAEVAAAADALRDGASTRLDLSRAAEDVWLLVRRLNRLVEQRAPWTLAKDPARAGELDQTLFSLAEGLRAAAILLWPVIPGSAARILAALGQDPADLAGRAPRGGPARRGPRWCPPASSSRAWRRRWRS